MALTGPVFEQDSKTVYDLLKAAVVHKPDVYKWIEPADKKQDGRKATQLLCAHYDGPGVKSKRLALAATQVEQLHYHNEQSFSFESYSSKLNAAFFTLADNGESKSQS